MTCRNLATSTLVWQARRAITESASLRAKAAGSSTTTAIASTMRRAASMHVPRQTSTPDRKVASVKEHAGQGTCSCPEGKEFRVNHVNQWVCFDKTAPTQQGLIQGKQRLYRQSKCCSISTHSIYVIFVSRCGCLACLLVRTTRLMQMCGGGSVHIVRKANDR